MGINRNTAEARILLDRSPSPQIAPGLPILAPYVDNGTIIGWDAADARQCRLALQDELTASGLRFRVEQEEV